MATVIDSKAPPSTGPPSSHNSSFQCTGEAVSHLGCKLSFLNPELLSGRETLDWRLRTICVHPTHPFSHRPPGASVRCTDGRRETPPPSFFHTLFYFPFLRTSERQKILEPEDEFESPGPHSGRKQTLNQKDEVSNLALGLQRFVTGNRGHLPSSVSLGS